MHERIEFERAPDEVLDVALDNGVALGRRNKLTPQIVVGGDIAALERLERALGDRRPGTRTSRLAVDAACHTALMDEARQEARQALAKVDLRNPGLPIVGDNGKVYTEARQILEKLDELTPAVNWPAAMVAAHDWVGGTAHELVQIGHGPLERLHAGFLIQARMPGISTTYDPFAK